MIKMYLITFTPCEVLDPPVEILVPWLSTGALCLGSDQIAHVVQVDLSLRYSHVITYIFSHDGSYKGVI